MHQLLDPVDFTNLSNFLPERCQFVSLERSQILKPGDWVSLNVLPSEYAHDMALLLCEAAEDQWLAWIPDFGEIELCLRQLCPL
jgi:hypothetical protein